MGRPKIEIDKKQFKSLCGMQCTLVEIADFFNCSEDTVERWCQRTFKKTFADTFKSFSGVGKISLRRKQFKLAEKSAAMAIFLGKQYLDQRDFSAIEVGGIKDGEPIKTEAQVKIYMPDNKRGDANDDDTTTSR